MPKHRESHSNNRVVIGAVLLLGAAAVAWAVTRKSPRPLPPPVDNSPATQPPPLVIEPDGPPPEQLPGFHDVCAEAGIKFKMHFLPGEQGEKFKINLYDHGCGLAVGDYDGDGDDDIYFCNQLGPNGLYRNDGDFHFTDVTDESGPIALDDRICVAATFSDYDNDGDQDLFVTSTRGGNVLFRNEGSGRFSDVTKEAGVQLIAHSQSAAFFDYDNDGDQDLLVLNTAKFTLDVYVEDQHYYEGAAGWDELRSSPKEKHVFYRNEGNGTFTDVTVEAGLSGEGWGGDVAVFDADNDGRLDLLITNMFERAQLYLNTAEAKFKAVGPKTLDRVSIGGVGARAFDIDNDGLLDALIVDMHSDMWMRPDFDPRKVVERKKYRLPNSMDELEAGAPDPDALRHFEQERPGSVLGNTLFHNLGGGRFDEISDKAGLETFWPWGAATGDFDNDGYVDVFIPSGMGYPFFYWPNCLMMNQGDSTFVDRSRNRGIEPPRDGRFLPDEIGGRPAPRSSRAAVTSDFDGDGRLDLLVNNFNDRPFCYRNEFPRQNYVAFRLRGTRSNRDAIGALVTLHFGDQKLVRQVDPAGGFMSHSSKTMHFGLGGREQIDRLEIRWPNGTVQTLDPPEINKLHELTEPEEMADAAP